MRFGGDKPRRTPVRLAVAALSAAVCAVVSAGEPRTALSPNVPPLARLGEDRGEVAAAVPVERIILTLEPRPGVDGDLRRFLESQQTPGSPDFHRWVTPQIFGARFGAHPDDLARVVSWLRAEGFRIESVSAGKRSLVFSGTAGQVARSFSAPIHEFRANGESRIANVASPSVPASIAGLVRGIVSLNDLARRSGISRIRELPAGLQPENNSEGEHFLAPADFSTIYDLGPLTSAQIDGRTHAVAVVGRTDIQVSDVLYFRSLFGLPSSDPQIIHVGPAPGITADEIETDLDLEWAGAAAPGATIKLVTAASTLATDGVDLAALWAVDHVAALAMSSSYGSCESAMGAAGLDFYNSLWAQAAAEGISVFVASGDTGAAACDDPSSASGSAAAVSGICSTPYDVCVGGTAFDDASDPALYWRPDNDPVTQASAIGYIPEVVWNESDSSGLSATGGGVSGVFAKPSWQNARTVPSDGARDVPDVSLAAAGHTAYLVVRGHSVASQGLVAVFGTSAGAPAMAGLMARVVQKAGGQGNANFGIYRLADNQYTHGGPAVFHDVTHGNNGVPGVDGFAAGPGFDLATGWGSVDGNAFVAGWPAVSRADFSISTHAATLYAADGGDSSSAVSVERWGGFSSVVTLSAEGLPAGIRADFSPGSLSSAGDSTLTVSVGASVARGPYDIRLVAEGGGQRHSLPVTIRVVSPIPAGVTTRSLATPAPGPAGIAAGSDGALWVAESNVDRIARLGGDGSVAEFPVPTAGAFVNEITAGPDDALWFTEFDAGKIGRISTGGEVTEFALPDPASAPYGIATGADGALWITLLDSNRIARLTAVGVETEFDLPTSGSEPNYIAVGPDGNLWFTEFSGNQIGRITLAGVVTEFPLPKPGSFPQGIVAGFDGAVWFAEAAGRIGRMTTSGVVTEFVIPTAESNPNSIVAGPDGALWFTERDGNQLGRIASDGTITEFGVSLSNLGPYDAAVGRDGAIWFTDLASGQVSRFPVASAAPVVLSWQSASVSIPESAGVLRMTVLRTGNPATSVDVAFQTHGVTAIPGKDYVGVLGSLTFQPGETAKTITIRLLDDSQPEPAETFKLTLSGPTGGAVLGGPAAAVVTILDDDSAASGTIAWAHAKTSVAESAGSVTVTAIRSGGSAGTVSIAFRTRGETALSGRDYSGVSGRLTFDPGATSKSVTIRLVDDATPGPSRTFRVELSAPDGGALLGSPSAEEVTISGQQSGAPILTEFDVPTPSANPNGITLGPDGALWYAEYDADIVGTIRPDGSEAEFLLSVGTGPSFLAGGPDGNVWFTEFDSDAIGRMTPSGVVTEFPLDSGAGPNGIAWGPDGALWFTEYFSDRIGRITTSGSVREFDLASGATPYEITAGPDGNLWFTELNGAAVGRLTPSGVLSEFAVPSGPDSLPSGIAAGPDGNLWFCEYGASRVGRATTAGSILEFELPIPGATPNEIAAGPDGNLWFTDTLENAVGVLSTGGAVTEYSLPDAASAPFDIVPGPDAALWLTEAETDRIGAISLSAGSTIQISDAFAGVAEDAGSIALLVTRTNSAGAPASVSFRTLGASATSGVDYSGVSGTLTFAAGESFKRVRIPILNRGGGHAPRSFRLLLGSPSGASLGFPASASITIVDVP